MAGSRSNDGDDYYSENKEENRDRRGMKGRHEIHPSKREITGSRGSELAGKKIVLCVTGSVAAYRAIDLARLLMRHGADVHAVMTESTATTLLTPDMMKWATGNDVVTRLTGGLEHVMLADHGMSDLVVVYPCTANTMGKAACGIDDTPVTSVLSVALGSKVPVIIAPAMHEAMYGNPFIAQNVEKLKEHHSSIHFVGPIMEEGKAKVAEPEDVLDAAVSIVQGQPLSSSPPSLSGAPLAGRKVLVTAGSTIEYIDPIRVLTNLSSGKTGVAIAQAAEEMGASVTLVYGHGSQEPRISRGRVIRAATTEEMRRAVVAELALGNSNNDDNDDNNDNSGSSKKNYDVAIMAAAVSDYTPAKKSPRKIDTRGSKGIELALVATGKIIDEVKRASPHTFLVAFKADHGVSDAELVDKAYAKLEECGADLVVANDLGRQGAGAGSDRNEVFVVDRKKRVTHLPLQSKQTIARKLLDIVASEYAAVISAPAKKNKSGGKR